MGRAACSGCCQESAMLLGDAQSFFRAPIRDGPGSNTHTHPSAVFADYLDENRLMRHEIIRTGLQNSF